MIPRSLQRHVAPSFLILGAEKGGTTALFHHLARHPQLVSPAEKEVCFFNKDALFARGAEWYRRQFPRAPLWSAKRSFEASPAYLYYPGVAARIATYAPRMKLIAVLRDPVARAYSAWNMHRQLREQRWEVVLARLSTQSPIIRDAMLAYYDTVARGDFSATVRELLPLANDNRVEPGLLKRGLYARQIAEYRRHLPASQMLVLESSRCRDDLAGQLDRVADFLGITRVAWSGLGVPEEHNHRRSYEAPLPDDACMLLRDFYREPNEELFRLLGERYAWNE